MTAFHFSENSDFVRATFGLNTADCQFPVLELYLQICNLTSDFIDNLMVITNADWYKLDVIDYDAYLNNW